MRVKITQEFYERSQVFERLIAELIMHAVPRPGDLLDWENLHFTVRRVEWHPKRNPIEEWAEIICTERFLVPSPQ